ncbi:MAG TPA: peptide deformylase [Gemmataceae bacterium]|nr:peptide deformylase [Gemmataceae bacterium]
MRIVHYPHPALRCKAQPLTSIDKQVQLYAGQMLDLMYEARGIGLAGPQVVLPYQILAMNPSGDPEQRDQEGVYLNPVIIERKGGTAEGEEGCLSLPGLYQKVRRAKSVKVHAYNLKGEAVEIVANELPARVWQHEVDHLHGVLFIDKIGPLAKLAARGQIKEFEQEYRKAQQRGEIPADAAIGQWLDVLTAGIPG